MPLTIVDHPLAQHYLTHLRDTATRPPLFRTLTRKLTVLLAVEACRDLRTTPRCVETPIEETEGRVLDEEIVVVPILRAGLGMLDAVVDMLPEVAIGYIGLERDEATAEANHYYRKLPSMQGRRALLIDPMLATGGSALRALTDIYESGASQATVICVIAAPEGVRRLEDRFPDLRIYTAALDRGLNDRKYILPGIGDFGDRLYGTT